MLYFGGKRGKCSDGSSNRHIIIKYLKSRVPFFIFMLIFISDSILGHPIGAKGLGVNQACNNIMSFCTGLFCCFFVSFVLDMIYLSFPASRGAFDDSVVSLSARSCVGKIDDKSVKFKKSKN